ncbi:MAG: twin-arginine translocase TatA/TatE family subunit [Erysipelothrix sp.]|nr:twin-arginine translocase TatA/TatE family subunit [Desulfitibacter alkalitolerans]MBS3987274.1 twin-arginine translocase TatA/TatE family subunit [Erysipelothrix sp.]
MIGPLGMWEIVLILIIALIIFGPGKLPEVGKAVGRGIKEFKSAANSITSDESEKEKKEAENKPS